MFHLLMYRTYYAQSSLTLSRERDSCKQ